MKKIIFALIALIIIINGVDANALDNSFREGEYLPGEYIIKTRNGSGKYEQMKMFRMNGSNQPVYCIELWESINQNKILSGYDFNIETYPSLDYDTLNRVILIAYYGYGYNNHTDIKWYAITQFMIWKSIAKDSDIYFTKTLNGNRIEKYIEEMGEIENLISSHYKIPSFHKTNHNLIYNDWYTITDDNNYLEYFNIYRNDNLEVIKSGNTIKVKTKKIGNSSLDLIRTDTMYTNNPTVYIDEIGQDLLLPGSYYPYHATVDFKLNTVNLTVHKYDFDTNNSTSSGMASLDGSIFQLLDNEKNVVDTKTVINGKAKFTNIGAGSYYLKEIKPGTGYKINEQEYYLHIVGANSNFILRNEVIKNKIIINKYMKDMVTSNIEKEVGAKFELYDKDNKKVLSFTTDKDGKYELTLPYGIYTLKQIEGNENYKLVDDLIIEVLEDNKTQEFNLYNEGYIYNLSIENLDYDSSKPILESGSSFIIKNIDTKEEINLITDNTGKTESVNLTTGNYEIIETSVVDGYILNTDKVEININKDNYNEKEEIIIPIKNKKKTSKIEFSKVIEYYYNDILKETKVDNEIEVPIYAKEDIYSKDGIKIYDKDEIVDQVTYDGTNIISKVLVLGDYYVLDLDKKTVDIKLDSIDTKKVSFLAKIYEYEKTVPISNIENIDNYDSKVIEVDNTLSKKSIIEDLYILIITLGLVLTYRRLENE